MSLQPGHGIQPSGCAERDDRWHLDDRRDRGKR